MGLLANRAVRLVRSPVRIISRRPLVSLVVFALVAAGLAASGVIWHAREQRLAAADLSYGRLPDAERRISRLRAVGALGGVTTELLSARLARLTGDVVGCERHLVRAAEQAGGATEPIQIEHLLLRAQTGELDDDAVSVPLFRLIENDHPDSTAILDTLSNAYLTKSRYQPARVCLTLWEIKHPEDSRVYHRRGWVYDQVGSVKAALADYQTALELDPGLTAVRLRVAEILLDEKMTPEAEGHLTVLLKTAPDRPEVLARMGRLRYLQGRHAEARDLLLRAEPALPTDPSVAIYLAWLDVTDSAQAEVARGAAAEKRLRPLIARNPSEAEARFVLITALRLQKRDAEADAMEVEHKQRLTRNEKLTQLLRDYADKPTADAGVYCQIGELFLEIGQDARGVYWLDKCLRVDPNYPAAHRRLADYYDRTGDKAAADRHRRLGQGEPPPPEQAGASGRK